MKAIATLVTLGSGALGGLAGPVVAINASLGGAFSRWIPQLRGFVHDRGIDLRIATI